MTYQEVKQMVASIGIPFAYYQFPEGTDQPCPFICFYFTGSNDLAADDTNYQRIRPLAIELYTDNKDFALENTVEAVLIQHGFVYSRDEAYIDTERMNMVTYTIEVIITEVNENG